MMDFLWILLLVSVPVKGEELPVSVIFCDISHCIPTPPQKTGYDRGGYWPSTGVHKRSTEYPQLLQHHSACSGTMIAASLWGIFSEDRLSQLVRPSFELSSADKYIFPVVLISTIATFLAINHRLLIVNAQV